MEEKENFRSKPRKRKSHYDDINQEIEENKKKGGLIYKTKKKKSGKVVALWCNEKELKMLDTLQLRGGYHGRSETIKAALSLAERNAMAIHYQEVELARKILYSGFSYGSIGREIERLK